MLRLEMRRGELRADMQGAFEGMLGDLRAEWEPLIRPVREAQSEVLGIDRESLDWGAPSRRSSILDLESDSLLAGEIFRVSEGIVVVTLSRPENGARITFESDGEGGIVAQDRDGSETLRLEVTALVHSNARPVLERVAAATGDHLNISLNDFKFENPRFEALRKEVVAEELPSEALHVEAANALLPRSARSLAVAIKSSRGMLAQDAERNASDEQNAEASLESLVQAGVLVRELVIVCNTTRDQIARLPEEGSLVELARVGLRCACGRPIEQERSEFLYTVTDVGRVLLDKSRWMSVLVREELVRLGVDDSDILLECQIGSDEIDCIALISGEISIFELKDKDFSIGNAYSFGAKMSILNAEHAVVVTTEGISRDVREHFNRTRQSERRSSRAYVGFDSQAIHYVEGTQFLDGLAPIVGSIYAKDGGRILTKALSLGIATSNSVIRSL